MSFKDNNLVIFKNFIVKILYNLYKKKDYLMQILIRPEDIIKRCLFSKYKKFVLKGNTKKEIQEIIEANEYVSLTENDAYVIGFLKVIETEDLVHRFRLEIEEFVKIKTTVNKDRVIINKTSILKEIEEFKDRFPESYKPNVLWEKSISDMKIFVDDVYEQVSNLQIVEIMYKEKTYTYVYSKEVNKILKWKI
jgi:hypothetical protein